MQVIKGIDLAVDDGEFIVFVGPSGCGKSTLLRIIAGLEDASVGEIHIDGDEVSARAPSERGLSMVFQSYALYPHMNVRDNIGFGLKTGGMDRVEIGRRVRQAADTLRLGDYLDRRPKQLSGGQRQRVAIGRAIVRQPKAFLFDEPLSNLDAGLRVRMRFEIARLHRDLGVTMIYVTHDQIEAMTLADRIVVLNGGRIMQTGSPRELYNAPANLFVAEFIGNPKMNVLGCGVGEDRVRIDGHEQAGREVGRTASRTGEARCPGGGRRPVRSVRAHCSGFVEVIEYLGSDTFVYIQCGEAGVLSVRVSPDVELARGDEVGLHFAPGKAHFFDAAESGHRLKPFHDEQHPKRVSCPPQVSSTMVIILRARTDHSTEPGPR